ncbi:MAG TPA: hypothetical protein VE913_03035 [Longimicrobium sp.]|nr:hypothetical protein [Longimicrobium sp.]
MISIRSGALAALLAAGSACCAVIGAALPATNSAARAPLRMLIIGFSRWLDGWPFRSIMIGTEGGGTRMYGGRDGVERGADRSI